MSQMRLSDEEILARVSGRSAVAYPVAAEILGICPDQVRKLIRQGRLVRVGEGRFNRKVTVASALSYAGIIIAELHRPSSNSIDLHRTRPTSTLLAIGK